MAQAEIKTKLTADGSELTRALQQGISKSADFKTQMQGIGKSIGAAFTFAAVVQGIRALGQEQLATIEKFKTLEQEADAFTKKLENLGEKVQNAESFKSLNKALLDYKQALREVGVELDALNAKEDAGGAAGILNFFGDVKETTASGNAITADEARLNQLEMQQERIQRARERAAKIAEQRRSDLRKEQRAALEEFDIGRTVDESIQTGNLPAMQAFLDAAKETERQLRSAFAANPDAGILAQIKEAVAFSDKLSEGIKGVGDQTVRAASDLFNFVNILDSNLRDASTRDMEQTRFSDLRRIGANELGRGIPATRQEDKQNQMIDLLKKQVSETTKIPEAVRSIAGFVGVFTP